MKSLSVITWNVWFDHFAQNIRYSNIFSICKSYSPDVICFQEATRPFLNLLVKHPLLQDYKISDLTGNTITPYGTITLVKSELNPKFSFYEFPTNMGRYLLLTEVNFDTGSFAFGNVHLESLNNERTRFEQLKICTDILKQYPSFVLCGDFNFCSYRNFIDEGELENNSLHELFPDALDLWAVLHPHEKGYTFNGSLNPLVTNPNEIMRYDRVLAKLSPSWKATGIQILGDNPIMKEESANAVSDGSPPRARPLYETYGRKVIPVFPSDHFGLLAQFIQN